MTNRRDVIIIGAPRSGTNVLRDVLTGMPGFSTWPCDEINYIWRYGHANYPSDELPPDIVTSTSQHYVRRAFSKVRGSDGCRVVEKTCANSLRVPFVEHVLDEPAYVFIVRDGLDAIASARLRWTAELDVKYLARKARFVPVRDIPVYAGRYASARLARLTSRERAVSTWGPRLHDMNELVNTRDLNEVCAIQWQRCVDAATRDLEAIDQSRVIRVKYEEFVRQPTDATAQILERLRAPVERDELQRATSRVIAASVGKGRQQLGSSESQRLEALIEPTLKAHGYVS